MEWISAKESMPNHLNPVIVFGLNRYGVPRKLRAFYAPKCTVSDDNENEAAEYCEEKDEYCLQEGWYEENEFEDTHWMIEFEITHWMPLPEDPN